jgi:hypothetical protein
MSPSVLTGRAGRRAVGLVVGSSVLLTAALVGTIAVVSTGAAGIGERAAFYVLAAAVVFVSLVIGFEEEEFDGRTILLSTAGLAGILGILIALVFEGLVYTLRYPATVLTSRLLLYLLAVGVVCTGLVYWGLRHWREFLPNHPDEL